LTGTVNQSFFWTINGAPINVSTPWGAIDSSGLYTAPSLLPANPKVTITASSLEDPSKSASAVATILATAGGITVTINPQNPQVVFDGSQSVQFTATVTGSSNTAVNWSLDNANGYNAGNITPNGVFTPLTFDCSNVVPSAAIHAVSVANPGAQGVTTVNLVPPTPVITGVSPQPAAAETNLQISGRFAQGATLTLHFPGPNGTTIPSATNLDTGTATGGLVPLGATSGPLSVQQICTSPISGFQYPPSESKPVNFQRLPQLRIRADKKDLASGESVQLRAAFLGDSTPQPVTWGTGISSSGLYTAPAQVASDTFVKLSACIAATTVCDSLVVRINPARIDPGAPTVPTNGTLQLSAISGGTTVAPIWSILAGGGSIFSSGLYTAPTVLEDTGPVLMTASYGGFTARASVGVTGAVPGLVNRIFDYPDTSTQPAVGTRSLVVVGSRAYTLSESTLSAAQEYCWIDVYDISDPIHPVWIDAAEALKSEVFPYKCSGKLYTYGGSVFELIPDAGTGQGVSTEIVEFTFQSNHLTFQRLWSVPAVGAYYSFNPAYTFNQGVFYSLPDTINPATSGGPISVNVFDIRTGNLVQSNLNLLLPLPGVPAELLTPTGSGNFIYLVVNQSTSPSTPLFKLAAYDVSVNPPSFLGTVDTMVGAASPAGPGALKIFGTNLFDGWDAYDISRGQPIRKGTVPFEIDDINLNRSLAFARRGQGFPTSVLDVSAPGVWKITGVLYDGLAVGFPVTWVGDLAYQTEGPGGWGIYSAVPPGGQLPLDPPPSRGGVGTIFDQLVNTNYLYVAQQGDFTGILIYDLSSSPPVLVGSYSETAQDPFSVALLKNYLFAGTAQGLLVLDVSTPSSPTKVATLALPTSALAISGNFLFAGTTDKRLVVLDVSNPAAPIQVAQGSLPDFPNILRTAGTLLFIADNTAGLLTYGISNPSTPVLLSQYKPASATEDVAIDGNLALLAVTDGGLVIADITNPAAPVLVGQANISTLSCFVDCLNPAAVSVAIHGGLAYVGSVGTTYGEVFGFDYRSTAHPRLVSLMSYGDALDEAVLNFAFYQSEMFVGGSLFAAIDRRGDISQPRNVINLYYPGFPGGSGSLSFGAVRKAAIFAHPKIRASARQAN
jgi:hypothetical protein